ncbi:hypothetical protein PRIPAC_89049 [Pristionchus pacificus]|uniref:Uncharacterized protein n=1 Tax=Pristionchus pacificus TaxID=54126 RepID=A0A2A6CWX4_PRIPA|nr:hypothetical protein PRIPAC_89049 [Pristionchus pacificus]|eukprot:PDM82590.1 hypothetical protein PRIPAC_36983 [Pristionchus pacificus]
MRWSHLLLVVCLAAILIPEAAGAGFKNHLAGPRGMKRRCHQCNMPQGCSSGSCVGDVCVKSVAASRSNIVYVSKGCENYTEHRQEFSLLYKFEEGCKQEWVFGVESLICYCSDADYCNSSSRSIFPLLPLPLLLLLRYLP